MSAKDVADNRGLYTDEHAKLIMANSIGKPYRPSNESEGEMFYGSYCDSCKRAVGCPIVCMAMAVDIDDEGYPKEWVYGDDGQPTCTAFEEK